MIKNIFTMIIFIFTNNFLIAYNVGDIIDNIEFRDIDFSDAGNIVTVRNIHDMIDSGKPIVIYFEEISYS